MRTADRLRSRLRKTEVLDLSCSDEFLDRARNVLDRHFRVNAVLIEEVDTVVFSRFSIASTSFSDMFGAAV